MQRKSADMAWLFGQGVGPTATMERTHADEVSGQLKCGIYKGATRDKIGDASARRKVAEMARVFGRDIGVDWHRRANSRSCLSDDL